ncbi:MAG: hypothetical protein ACLQO7_02020 [Candidatus Bathyarchaeia archaeon]
MPLTDPVRFKAPIGKGNRKQIPTLIQWEFKLEPTSTPNSTRPPVRPRNRRNLLHKNEQKRTNNNPQNKRRTHKNTTTQRNNPKPIRIRNNPNTSITRQTDEKTKKYAVHYPKSVQEIADTVVN